MPLVMDTRPAAYAVIIDNEHILLSRWVPHIPGMQPGWMLPGGGMEPGEQPGQSAVREVFEETGYRVELDELLGVNTAYYPPNEGSELPFCALRIIFRTRTVGGELTHEIGGFTDRVAWIPLAELDQHFYYPSVDEAALAEHYRSLGNGTEKKES